MRAPPTAPGARGRRLPLLQRLTGLYALRASTPQHRGTFGGGAPGCKAHVTVEASLAVGRCGCAGYTKDAAAFTESIPLFDIREARLRRPHDPVPADAPRLAPVRDLFDEGRRRLDLSESGRLPWRPPS